MRSATRRTIFDKLGQKGEYDASPAPSGDGEAPHVVQPELERRAFMRQRKEGLHRRRAVEGERRHIQEHEYHAADDPVNVQRTEAERVDHGTRTLSFPEVCGLLGRGVWRVQSERSFVEKEFKHNSHSRQA